MIRFAKNEDFEKILALWYSSFEGSELFAQWYFENIYKPENTLVFEENGSICSALQRLPNEIKNIGQVTYIFGACTHPDYRKKGLMAKLLEYSEKLDKENDIKASVLIPQEKSLFDYYKNFGYSAEFSIFSKKYIKQNPKTHSYNFSECKVTELYRLNELYEKDLIGTNFVVRDNFYWDKQFSMFNFLDGNIFCLKLEQEIVGYAFSWKDEEAFIQELVGLNNDIKKILCFEIMKHFNVNEINAFSLTGNLSRQDFGCIKLYEPAKNDLPFAMNLMFN